MEILGDSHSSGKDPKDQAEQQITGVTSYQFYVEVSKKKKYQMSVEEGI